MAKKKMDKKVAFRDRKAGLVMFGIIHIIIGIFCALGIPLTIFSMMAASMFDKSAAPPMSIGQMILVVIIYLLLAVWFLWMGIGSILARKWARAFILITSWLWFISGIGGFVFILLFIPDVYGSMATRGAIPQEMVVIVQSMVIAFMALILIVIPGAFILLYSSRHVKATCEQRDPQVRWTDKAPLSVITVSSLLGVLSMGCPVFRFRLERDTRRGSSHHIRSIICVRGLGNI